MPAILKSAAKALAAENFLENFYDVGGSDRVYIGLANNQGAEWGTPSSPDAPVNTDQEEDDFWTGLVGVGLVNSSETDLVVPKKPWAAGNTYVAYDPTAATGPGTYVDRDFYIINSSNQVYVCLTAGGGVTANEPSHTNPAGVTGADGYKWGYLYTVGTDVGALLLSNSWMPVPISSSVAAWQNSTAYAQGDIVSDPTPHPGKLYQTTSGGTSSGTGVDDDTGNTWVKIDPKQTIGAFFVACSLSFPDFAGTGNKIPNVAYRQVALLRNPQNTSGSNYTGSWGAPADLETTLSRGIIMTVDNRTTITRAVGQTETIRTILEF